MGAASELSPVKFVLLFVAGVEYCGYSLWFRILGFCLRVVHNHNCDLLLLYLLCVIFYMHSYSFLCR